MSTKPPWSADSHYLAPVVLLCAVCVVASFSSLIYAISVSGDMDALSTRLATLETSCGCDGRAPLPANFHSDRSQQERGWFSLSSSTNMPSSGGEHLGIRKEDTFLSSGNVPPETNEEYKAKRVILSGKIPASDSSNVIKQKASTKIHPSSLLQQMDELITSYSTSNSEAIKDDVVYKKVHQIKRGGNYSATKIRLKRSPPQNREFHNEEDAEDISRADRRARGRRRGGGREESVLRSGSRMAGIPETLAVHFEGDTSKYSLGHRHYEGNGRLRHPDGIFRDWRLKEWNGRYDRNSRLQETEGALEIRDSGIYFIYAQVYYLDDHDVNGFRVLVNDSPVLQCTVMSHGGALSKANTCFTGGLVELQTGDNIRIRDIAALRYSIFEPGKSFFGLFRVARHSAVVREGP